MAITAKLWARRAMAKPKARTCRWLKAIRFRHIGHVTNSGRIWAVGGFILFLKVEEKLQVFSKTCKKLKKIELFSFFFSKT